MMTAVLVTAPACTVVSMGVGAGVTRIHNSNVDERDKWDYAAPMITSALIGLVVDILFLKWLARQWSKPMNQ